MYCTQALDLISVACLDVVLLRAQCHERKTRAFCHDAFKAHMLPVCPLVRAFMSEEYRLKSRKNKFWHVIDKKMPDKQLELQGTSACL